jgi:hypothetical protein
LENNLFKKINLAKMYGRPLSPCININSERIKYFTIRPEILKLLEENIGKTLQDIGTDKNYLNRIPISPEIKTKTNILHNKEINKVKRQCSE